MDWDGKTERRAPVTEIQGDPTNIVINPGAWHIKQEVILALICGFIGNLVVAVGLYYNIVGRQDLQQADLNSLHQNDIRFHDELAESVRLMREQYHELSGKMDRLIERGMK